MAYLNETGLQYLLLKIKNYVDSHSGGTPSESIFDLVYPVGSIYTSVNSTNPETLFGGTWERITGRFLLAATDDGSSGSSQAAGNTGGEATHVLTPDETATKNHSHTMNHGHANTIKATTPKLTHSVTQPTVPKHSHTYAKPDAYTDSHTLTAAQSGIPAHSHAIRYYETGTPGSETSGGTAHSIGWGGSGGSAIALGYAASNPKEASKGNLRAINHAAEAASSGHKHGISTTSTNTSEKAATACTGGAVGDHAATACTMSGGVTDYSGSTGGQTAANGSAHNNMPPFLAVYVWKRTA